MTTIKNINIADLLRNVNASLNSPYCRNIYLKQADVEFERGNIPFSVFYQTEALCLGYRYKYLANKDVSYREVVIDSSFENSLLKYAAETVKLTAPVQEKHPSTCFGTDPKAGLEAIRKFCLSLPREWTVLQLCKSFNPIASSSLKKEIITANCPIYLTVLKNTQADLYSDPLCFKIKTPSACSNVYSLCQEISEKLKNGLNILAEGGDQLAYNMNLQSVENDIRDSIQSLKQWLGPWRCFFRGPATSASLADQDAIYSKVKQFTADNNLKTKEYIILCNLAMFAKELTGPDVAIACSELSQDSLVQSRITKFLRNCRQISSASWQCYPCILIVDELLDQFFWEMLNDRQEICRNSSLHLLKSIHGDYRKEIIDGYVRRPINVAKWILNPDKTLHDMEQRITSFIVAWDPKLDCFVDRQPPNADTIAKYLGKSDLFIYSGHGSGLQFFNGHKITNLRSNSVVFLLGCDSTRLKSDGLHSEMMASHLYYFATRCPAVVGTILMAFDRKMDSITTDILSAWIPTNGRTHWRHADQRLWTKYAKVQFKVSDDNEKMYEPRLSRLICNLRREKSTLHSRVHFVYRGLPVWNENIE